MNNIPHTNVTYTEDLERVFVTALVDGQHLQANYLAKKLL